MLIVRLDWYELIPNASMGCGGGGDRDGGHAEPCIMMLRDFNFSFRITSVEVLLYGAR